MQAWLRSGKPEDWGVNMRMLSLCVLLAGLIVACSSSPTSPGEKALTVFRDRNYGGSWLDIYTDESNLGRVNGPCNQSDTNIGDWDDCISSIRLSPGWVATGYRDRNFSGPTVEITGDIPNLRDISGQCDHGFDDCLSSIRVTRQ